MIDSGYISKHSSSKEELDFNSLKEQALDLIQGLAGKTWTDYNPHDPGITILEQLCYAITELVYKSDFSVADFLTSKDGTIHFDELAIYKPNEIFPSQAITINDYRKIIFDSVSGVVDVWVEKENLLRINGLYNIYLRVRKPILNDDAEKQRVVEDVKQIYGRNRNLGEDLNEVIIVNPAIIKLNAELEIETDDPPEEVLAEIFFQCSKKLNPGITYYSFKEMLDKGMTLEEILSGPYTSNGYIRDQELFQKKEIIYIADFMEVLTLVKGVKSISSISMEQNGQVFYDQIELADKNTGPSFDISSQMHERSIILYQNGRKHIVDIAEAINLFKKKVASYAAIKNTVQDLNKLIQTPAGEYVDFESYRSVQHDFPEVYGINELGVPDSFPAKRKAQAKQLKAYLLLFEQLIANFLSQMENAKNLYSIKPDLDRSYFSQYLADVPHVKDLYFNTKNCNTDLDALIRKHDEFGERRNRFLDYLLALYGEAFSHNILKQFNYYYTEQQFEDVLINNKISFLKNLVSITRYRAKAYNYLAKKFELHDFSGLKLKSAIQLGIKNLSTKFVTDVFYEKGIHLTTEVEYENFPFDLKKENSIIDADSIESNFENIPCIESIQNQHFDVIYNFVKDERLLFNNIVAEDLLRFGVSLDNYLIGEFEDLSRFAIIVQNKNTDEWFFIKDFRQKQDAIDAANYLCTFFKHLNIESENFHILEHIILRPEKGSKNYSFFLLDSSGERIFESNIGFSYEERENVLDNLIDLLHTSCDYVVGETSEGNYVVELAIGEYPVCRGLKEFETKEGAENHIETYCKYIEDFHNGERKEKLVEYFIRSYNNLNISEDYYSSRVSIVLPNWTARFNNKHFRLWAEDTIRSNCPAHIYPEFFWFDIHKMKEFELLYNYFLQLKSTNKSTHGEIEDLAAQILELLIENNQQATTYIV